MANVAVQRHANRLKNKGKFISLLRCVAIWRHNLSDGHRVPSLSWEKRCVLSLISDCARFLLCSLYNYTDEESPIIFREKQSIGVPESDVVEDFSKFCESFDVRAVIAASDGTGRAHGFEKEIYALAIQRALHHGELGEDCDAIQIAISSIWERGYRYGFNADTFNEAFQEYFACW